MNIIANQSPQILETSQNSRSRSINTQRLLKLSTGERLVGCVLKYAGNSANKKLWLLLESDKIVALKKDEDGWSPLLKKRTFSQKDIASYLDGLGDKALIIEAESDRQQWTVKATESAPREYFLERIS